ncbi:PfkB family carbohydrate kinase [Streptomyces bambusae]|uniref:PfkB family carbohydrate kinase n=1 Tax=Streptomyces bambusae TaxID=1550616 RepID=UPI0021F6179A|nr:PfkB family carbohydrate kinase [Streptomyces bambusae]
MSVFMFGPAESDVARRLARHGRPVVWAGAVGNDELGEAHLAALAAAGVDVSYAQRDPRAATGAAAVRILSCALHAAFVATGPRVLYLTGVTPALGRQARSAARLALQLAAEHSALVVVDVHHRPHLWSSDEARTVLSEWAPHADVLLATHRELALCLPDPPGGTDAGAADANATDAGGTDVQIKELLALGPGEVVLKAAAPHPVPADGAPHTATSHAATSHTVTSYTDDGPTAALPLGTPAATPDDDTFAAGYLAGLLDGLPAAARLARAAGHPPRP